MTRWRQAALLAVLLLAAGCLGAGDGADEAQTASVQADEMATNGSANVSQLWEGATRLEVANSTLTNPTAFEADALCAFGGAPPIERTDNRVLPGTGELEILVDTSTTSTGLQVGYVVDPEAPDYARDQDAITWLASVPPATSETFTLDVGADGIEEPGEARAWTFYVRVNPGADELCYTGASVGERAVVATAVRAG